MGSVGRRDETTQPAAPTSSTPASTGGTRRLPASTLAGLVAAGFALLIIIGWLTFIFIRRRRRGYIRRDSIRKSVSSIEETKRRPPNIHVNSVVLATTPMGTGGALTPGTVERLAGLRSPESNSNG